MALFSFERGSPFGRGLILPAAGASSSYFFGLWGSAPWFSRQAAGLLAGEGPIIT